MNNDLMFATGNNSLGTPFNFYYAMNHRAGGFVADMAAEQALHMHEQWYGPDHHDVERRNCLTIDWPDDGPVFLNPPYSEPERACHPTRCKKKRCKARGYCTPVDIPGCIDFVAKAAEQRLRGVETWALLASRTDCQWFHQYVWDHRQGRSRDGVVAEFLEGRLTFRRNGKPDPAPFPSLLAIFRP